MHNLVGNSREMKWRRKSISRIHRSCPRNSLSLLLIILGVSYLSQQICSDIISTALLSIYFHVSAGLHCSNKLGIYEWMCLTIFVAAIIWWTVYPSHPHRWEGLARYLGRMLSSARRGRVDGGREHFGSLTMKQQPRLSRSLTQPRLESLNKNVFFYFR